uniref:Uncharacterized protein n=1 Tax=viral metagenome TaxID=1070528 RepID=A0A6M3KHB8_9ZZZZ
MNKSSSTTLEKQIRHLETDLINKLVEEGMDIKMAIKKVYGEVR